MKKTLLLVNKNIVNDPNIVDLNDPDFCISSVDNIDELQEQSFDEVITDENIGPEIIEQLKNHNILRPNGVLITPQKLKDNVYK